MKYFPTLLIVAICLVPDWVYAIPFVPCDGVTVNGVGVECSACDFVELGNRIVSWIITMAFLFFAVLAVIAGFKLVTSGGNPEALSSAKQSFINAFIGIIIVLASFLLVDTVMRKLLVGGQGTVNGIFWATVECHKQTIPVPFSLESLQNENEASVSGSNPSGTSVTPNVAGLISMRGAGLNVAEWPGINGPNRTDKADPVAVAAAVKMQEAGKNALGGKIPFQITAGYTEGVGHSKNSKHYDGIAIDFQPINGASLQQVAQLARDAGFTYVLIESRHVHADMR